MAQLFEFVASGEGISFVRASATHFKTKDVALRPITELPMLDVGLAYRRDIRSPLVRNLLQIVQQEFKEARTQMIRRKRESQ